ncbi:cyclophilin-like fold protein [Limosilactobacillus sp.]|uniref:cyclophilin-like fold protein n=1 Tax=Limosilactobacillus sp. TaxID=2773925 RepID=UPI00345E1EE1
MNLRMTDQAGHQVTIALNDSNAAKDLVQQKPSQVRIENYSNDEKTFYPDKKLDLGNTPRANAVVGTLGYFAPWGDVCLFYRDFGPAGGLYDLGMATEGKEQISLLSGTTQLEFFE